MWNRPQLMKDVADLLMDEAACWDALPAPRKSIFAALLQGRGEFDGFLAFVGAEAAGIKGLAGLIRSEYSGKICASNFNWLCL